MDEEEEYSEIVKERYDLVLSLRLISRRKGKWGVLAKPDFVKKQFGCFLPSPLHTFIATLEIVTTSLAIHENKLYSGSSDTTIRIWCI